MTTPTKNSNDSLDKLRQRSEETISICQQYNLAHRTNDPFIYTLTTGLQLAGVEIPNIDLRRYPRLSPDRLQVVVQHHNSQRRRTKKVRRMETFIWDIPLDAEEIAENVVCASPLATWFMFAMYLSLEELVVLGDCILRRKTVHAPYTLYDFEDYIDRLRRLPNRKHAPRGIVKSGQALDLMRENTDSSQETRLRLALVRLGLPCPKVNYPITTVHGEHVWLDLAYPDECIAIEYDGVFHSEQWLHDSDRRTHIEDSGWMHIQVTKTTLFSEENLIRLASRIRQALIARAPRPTR